MDYEERESLQADIDKLASTIGCLENLDGAGAEDDDDQGKLKTTMNRVS